MDRVAGAAHTQGGIAWGDRVSGLGPQALLGWTLGLGRSPGQRQVTRGSRGETGAVLTPDPSYVNFLSLKAFGAFTLPSVLGGRSCDGSPEAPLWSPGHPSAYMALQSHILAPLAREGPLG